MRNVEHEKVSVLMAVFNTEEYLRDAIWSVLSQTYENLELIIVDDCSTDGSWLLISEAAGSDGRVRALRQQCQGGASRCLNAGLAIATGGLITRQDSDDISMPDRLKQQVTFLSANTHIGAAGTQAIEIDPKGRTLAVTSFPADSELIRETLDDHMCLVGPTVMVQRSAFERIGLLFDETLSSSEDYDLCLRLVEVTKLTNLPRPLYFYRHRDSSVSRSLRAIQMLRKARALEKAAYRRHGVGAPPEALAHAARDYVKAAVIAHATGEPIDSTYCISRARMICPAVFSKTGVLEQLVRRLTPAGEWDFAIRFTRSLFEDVLPHTASLKFLKHRLIADLHLAAVFREARTGSFQESTHRHLWLGIRNNPTWLANRGVWSLIRKSLVSRAATHLLTRGDTAE